MPGIEEKCLKGEPEMESIVKLVDVCRKYGEGGNVVNALDHCEC